MKHLFLFLLLLITTVRSVRRLLVMEKTPGCSNCTFPVFYAKAKGPNDTLHYVFDFAFKPTVFVALTPCDTTIAFDWTRFANGNRSISFKSQPQYTFALVFNKLIEFDDASDTGVLTPSTQNVSYDMSRFAWEALDFSNCTTGKDFVSLRVRGSNHASGELAGSLTMEFTAFGFDGHDAVQPRLMHSANTTQCRLTLDNLRSRSRFNSTRFAVDFVVASSDSKASTSRIVSRTNFDDENSPGVFSIVDFMTPNSQDHMYGGAFLQWRPVSFVDKVPSLVNSTEVLTYDVTDVNEPQAELRDTAAYKYYGDDVADRLVQQMVVSIGLSEDGFYTKTNYSSWTFTINYGSPETEKFSLLVIMVMAIGLGFPVVLILVGGCYMLGRRLRNKHELTLTR